MNEYSEENGSALHVSNAWKSKFDIFHEIGADKQFIYKAMSSPEYKGLGFKEKHKVSFHILAFLFGPLYYFFKAMWFKGAFLVGTTWVLAAVLTLVEAMIGVALPAVLYWIPPAVICAQLASYDYFKKVTAGEKLWSGLPSILSKPVGAIGFPILAFVCLLGVSTLSPAYIEEMKAQTLEDVSGVWRGDMDGAMIMISLTGEPKVLSVNGVPIPVSVESIDLENHIITLGVVWVNEQKVFWALRQIFDNEGRFTLHMTLHDGTYDSLSYVRNL